MKPFSYFGLIIVVAGSAAWLAFAAPQQRPARQISPASLLPADAVLLASIDGSAAHQPAISQTAAWQSLNETGLQARFLDLAETLLSAAGPDVGPVVRRAFDSCLTNGVSLAVSVSNKSGSVDGYGLLVLHDAAELQPDLEALLKRADANVAAQITVSTVSGRRVSAISPNPAVSVAWWSEGSHLVIAAGTDPVTKALAVADGEAPNVTTSPLWTKLRTSDRFTVDCVGWFDAKSVLDEFGDIQVPRPRSGGSFSVRQIADALGLAQLQTISSQGGYSGEETWQTAEIVAPGERKGLLAMLDQRVITLDELPAMPTDSDGFFAAAFDLRMAVEHGVGVMRDMVELIEPEEREDFENGLRELEATIGGKVSDVFSGGLGDLFCVYSDPSAMPIPIGFSPVAVASVADRAMVEATIDRLLLIMQSAPDAPQIEVRRTEKDGNTYYSFPIPGAPIVPTILVTDDWLLGSITPGSAQSFLLRANDKLPSWEPNERVAAALTELPSTFTSISVSDPAPGYRQIMNFAPMGLGLIESQFLPMIAQQTGGAPPQMPFQIQDLPAAEQVTAPMFPNVSVGVSSENGLTSYSRQSVPSTPVGNVSSTAAVPILVALLLPAVQQAREAARRTQSKNNLKMIGLALHNYHDTHNHFPRGTVENAQLKPDERLSWAYSILPYLEQAPLYNTIDAKGDWKAAAKLVDNAAAARFTWYQNPSMPRRGEPASSMDYVGIAGIGKDAATLPKNDPKAGIFGYDRETSFRDIRDGTSNTIAVSDAAKPNTSFLAGGRETIRGFSQQPYINGPDGIGSPHQGGMQVLFADGSVRFLSENIDPSVLEGLATMNGGEAVNID